MQGREGGLAGTGGASAPIEAPEAVADIKCGWGSDYIAEAIRALGFEFIALNPGSSFRGLHDSIVNYLGNTAPQLLLCMHEEHAVALAHGWSKVTEKPMAVALHSNVGLMHASMAIFNAWCDRAPVVILGGNGPLDAAKRRPWIDWIHTSADPAAMIRSFVKWDDQPLSVAAAIESLMRANLLARTAPTAPVYVSLDAEMQEAPLPALPITIQPERHPVPAAAHPAPALVSQVAELLATADRPLILMGRTKRDEESWTRRIALAERLGACVLTDLKLPAAFPSRHPLHRADAGMFLTPEGAAVLREADVILSLDWVDLSGAIRAAWGEEQPSAKIIQASVDHQIHNGLSRDHLGLPPVDLPMLCEPDVAVATLLEALPEARRSRTSWSFQDRIAPSPSRDAGGPIQVCDLGRALKRSLGTRPACLVRAPLSWSGAFWEVNHPLDYLGYDGGGGIGSGPGMVTGAALALRGTGRLPLAVLGDGDFVMGSSAIWTAVHYEVPLLIIVANNSSFFNDEMHQDRVARARSRPVENRWIGQRIADPPIDIAGLARALGAVGTGPVTNAADLDSTLAHAIHQVEHGQVVVVDVHVFAGYGADFNAAAFGPDNAE